MCINRRKCARHFKMLKRRFLYPFQLNYFDIIHFCGHKLMPRAILTQGLTELKAKPSLNGAQIFLAPLLRQIFQEKLNFATYLQTYIFLTSLLLIFYLLLKMIVNIFITPLPQFFLGRVCLCHMFFFLIKKLIDLSHLIFNINFLSRIFTM